MDADADPNRDLTLVAPFLIQDAETPERVDRRIQRVRAAVPPPAGLMTDGDVINHVARRMGHDLGFDDAHGSIDPSRIMDEIVALTPSWGGVSYARLEKEGYLQWPCYDAEHPGTKTVHEGGRFLNGRARLRATPWQEPGETPDEEYPFYLTTGRMLFQYNVGTLTRRTAISRLDKAQEETLRIHPKDAHRLGLTGGEPVDVVSRRGRVRVCAEITKATNPGTLFMTFHYPETPTNILIGDAKDEYTGCPEYKVSAVRVEKVVAETTAVGALDAKELVEAD